MKLKFKTQAYQTHAVDSVVDCFVHQPMHDGLTYRIDPGQRSQASAFDNEGFKNADLAISEAKVLENIQAVQRRQNLPVAESLTEFTTYDKRGNRGPVKAAYKRMLWQRHASIWTWRWRPVLAKPTATSRQFSR
ncbi:hypothetical protein HAALTHF_23810n [Vreelandella aquamarina]|nr:hypothetical protein HAALTHF_23810n [Halomonas axialensis]